MAISKNAKLAREKRVLKRLEYMNIPAKTADLNEPGKRLVSRLVRSEVRSQRDYIRELEKSK